MRIVCDTNVILSALLFPGGPPDKIWRAVLSGQIENSISPDILTELRTVLTQKFRLDPNRIEEIFQLIRSASLLVYPPERLKVITKDETDNRILECALEAKAQIIVTGDHQHLLPLKSFEQILILSSRECLEKMGLV